MKLRTIIFAILILFAFIFFVVKFAGQPRRMEYAFYPMGGIPCRMVLYADSHARFESDVAAVMKRVDDLENIFNLYRSESELSKLNQSAFLERMPASPDMYEVLERSLIWYGRSAGAFDVTVEPLIDLWKRAGEEGKTPPEREIQSVLDHVGSDLVTLSSSKGVRFEKEGVRIVLSGIAKGYILNQIGALLQRRGIEKYIVSCGGDVVMRGKERFRVGIQEPGAAEGHLMIVLNAGPGAVVTSGHYERFVAIDGRHYSHIIDPVSGHPVENDLVSVTIAADDAADADALATAVAVLGLEKSIAFLAKSDLYRAVLLQRVGDQYEIYYSKALEGQLEYHGRWQGVKKKPF